MAPANQTRPRRNRLLQAPITLALLVAITASACAFPQQGFDGSLVGTYYVNGVDPEGTEYGGTLEIVATDQPDVVDMQWIITGSIQTGKGTVTGTELDVEWQGFDSASQGTARYDINDDGELHGERTVAGEAASGTEEAFPVK